MKKKYLLEKWIVIYLLIYNAVTGTEQPKKTSCVRTGYFL